MRVSAFIGQPYFQFINGIHPSVVGSVILAGENVMSIFIFGITQWALAVVLPFLSKQLLAHSAHSCQMSAQESPLAQWFSMQCFSNGCPIDLVHMLLCQIVSLLPHLQKFLSIDGFIQLCLVHPREFVSSEVDLQCLVAQWSWLRLVSLGNALAQQTFGSGIHLHIQFCPSVEPMEGFVFVLVPFNVSPCHFDGKLSYLSSHIKNHVVAWIFGLWVSFCKNSLHC